MKKVLFTLLLLTGLAQVAKPQNELLEHENLTFDSELEMNIWKTGNEDPFQLFRAVQADQTSPEDAWASLVEDLDSKASKKGDELNFLRQIFQKTHQKLLKKYELHSSFNSMLSEGKFDCVSGSAALGLLLERYEYSFDIVETDFHVFIVVNLEGKKVVLESTLPVGGMITMPSEVQNYLDAYRPEANSKLKVLNQGLAGQHIDYSDNAIFRIVNLKQLAGLQYYNDAIVHFNTQAFGQAVDQLSKAYLLYPSDRILGLRELSIDLAYKTYGYELKK
ncbi:hypothetical protein [Algoriphagus sp. A40]|uniref:hypothetical protein n=1 Tax=Algoriphagus sp. A40 TaxID=1945863 RepID=UPI00098690A7|nr:hypothetical protein [Algoriphagus sp. A40]OOG78849.1 hypothetical protein B0E43_00370 [Algoriphagus sp. A40]